MEHTMNIRARSGVHLKSCYVPHKHMQITFEWFEQMRSTYTNAIYPVLGSGSDNKCAISSHGMYLFEVIANQISLLMFNIE